MQMKDKTALITGSANGIGAKIAQLFGEQGAQVWLLDRDEAALVSRTKELKAAGIKAEMCLADLTRPHEVTEAVAGIYSRMRSLDVLVNNAGIDPRMPFTEMEEEEWLRVIDVNLHAAYRCTRAVIPQMIESRRGKIVNISSITFHLGLKNLTHYISAKGGLIGFTRGLARDVGEFNIHVNCITPGAILTDRESEIATPEEAASVIKLQCLQRRIIPLDIARTCLFLATEWSDGLTGQTLNVDGGWVMH